VKTLGPNRRIPIIRPGDYLPPLARPSFNDELGSSESNEDEGMPTVITGAPICEPLVLWRDPDDNERVIEVINLIRQTFIYQYQLT